MSFQFRGIAPLRVLAATLLLLGMGQARAADWEAGDVTYHSTCAGSGCHSSNPLLPGDAGHSPANEFVDAATLQGFIDGGMGGSATSALSTTSVQNIADYLGNLAYPVAALSGGTALADVPLSQTSTQTFTLSSSHGTLTVGSIKVMNGAVEDATNFSVALHACTTVTTATPCAFDVTFQPKSVGSFSRTLTILHNDQRGVSTAALSVSGLAPFTVNSSALDFTASSAPAGMLPKTLTDRVGGVRICRADASTFNFPADFSIDAPYALGPDGCFTTSASGVPQDLPLKIRFTPGDVGPRNGALTISRTVVSTLFQATIQLHGNPGPVATVDATSLFDLPSDPGVEVDNDNVLDRKVTIFSKGTDPLDFTSTTFTRVGTFKDEYTVLPGGCQSLTQLPAFVMSSPSSTPPSCELTLRFNPAGTGLRNPAELLIKFPNAADNTVELKGFGILGPRLSVQQGGMPMASGDVLQFGTQTKGGLYAAKSIALLNGGTQGNLDVVLPAAGSIAGFTFTAGNGCNSLAPAAVCTVDIRFDPAAVQAYDSVLSIQTSPAGSPGVVSEFHLSLKGQGRDSAVPTLRWTNDSGTPISQLGFDPTDTSAPTVKTIRLYNDGKGGALLQLANLVGLDASNFRLDTTDCPKDKVLYEATSCALVVTFSPSTPGLKTASIQFTASGSTPPSLVVAPLMVASGTGTGVAVPASLQISSAALNLGATTVGAAGLPQELTLSNSGSRVVRVLAMDVSAPFSVQGKTCASPPFELAPGTGCTINVTVTPQAEGPLAGMLIVTTDGTPATQQVALSANAEPKADVSSGGGCSIATGDSVLDPMLWLMGALAFAVLVARRREPTARGDDANCKGGR